MKGGPARHTTADLAVPGVAEVRDESGLREALHVLHERWAASDPAFVGPHVEKRGACVARVEVVDDSGRLAPDVANRRRHELHAHAGVGLALGDRLGQHSAGRRVLAAHIQDHVRRPDRLGGHDRAVQHQVGSALHQGTVLGAPRFALGAIHDHDRIAGGVLGDRPPLAPDGEAGTAAAEQTTRFDNGDDVPPVSPRWQVAKPGAVRREALGTVRKGRSG